MKKIIKGMVVTAQTARFIELMPKPKDFVTRVVGDVVYLSAKVQKLSDDVNKLLDQYANIPADYIMMQMNGITDAAANIVDQTNMLAQNALNQGSTAVQNGLEAISSLAGGAVDIVKETSNAVVSLAGTVSHTSSAVLGNATVAANVKAGVESIMEWNGKKFDEIKSTVTEPVAKAAQKVEDAKSKVSDYMSNTAKKAQDIISKPQEKVQNLLKELKTAMDNLSNKLDTGFGDVTGVNSIAKGANFVTEALKNSDNNSPSAQAVSAVSESVSYVLKNFSISKVVKAFAGVVTCSVLTETGLSKLPPINVEKMRFALSDNIKIQNSDVLKKLHIVNDETLRKYEIYGEDDSFSKIPSEVKVYSSKKYNEFIKQFESELQEQRDAIRVSMNKKEREHRTDESLQKEMMDRQENPSAIKGVQKFQDEIKNAQQSKKLMSIIKEELKGVKKEFQYTSNSLKSDWESMLKQYKDSINEIKQFFQKGGDGDKFIDDCCDNINKDADEIKKLCSDLIIQLANSAVKIILPADLGIGLSVLIPNPLYKIADFFMDIKTILKFIRDIIMLIIDIINNINKLARIILNGLNSLKEIIKELMELIGFKWLMNIVQNLLDFAKGKAKSSVGVLNNQKTPVYYKDTDKYQNEKEELEKAKQNQANSPDKINPASIWSILRPSTTTDYDKLLDDLEKKGNTVVAYKYPQVSMTTNEDLTVDKIVDNNGVFDFNIEFNGWRFHHPDGSNWYNYHTNDMEKDGFDPDAEQDSNIIDSTMQTENGTMVELNDGRKVFVPDSNVKTGDYVKVEGIKYRVK